MANNSVPIEQYYRLELFDGFESNTFIEAIAMGDLIALVLFIAAGSFSPGPNNMMVLASSMRFGFIATVPHMVGNSFGMITIALGLGFGLAPVLNTIPALQVVFKVLAVLYLIYLGISIARAGSPDMANSGRPLKWWQGTLFQWVNAKGWTVVLGALLAFTVSDDRFLNATIVATAFFIMGFAANCSWMAFGGLIRAQIYGGPWHRPVHIFLGGSVIAS